MTTIAADRACMAADSALIIGDIRGSTAKLFRIDKFIVGTAGGNAEGEMFMRWLRGRGKRPKFDKDSDFVALILSPEGLFHYEWDCTPTPLKDPFYAIGSGAAAALAAMHCGRTPEGAVEVACKVDVNTCGPVDALHLEVARAKRTVSKS